VTSTSELPTKPARRAALAFIFITIVLDMLAVGMIIPVLPKLVATFLGGDTAKAARIYGIFATVWALMQFVFAPLLGTMSDRFGRRPIVLLSNFGLGLDYILMALAPTLSWLFVGRVISGITAASVPTAGAYIADVTPEEKRAKAFGTLGAAFGVGFIVGPAVGGLLGSISARLPFWVAAALSLTNAMYGLFILPESLSRDKRAAFSWKRANPLGSLKLLRSHHELFGLAGATFLSALAHDSLPSTFVYYADYRYHWTPRTIGFVLATVGICFGIVQGAFVGRIVGRLGERLALIVGLLFGTLGFAIYGLAAYGWIFWLGIPVMSLWGISGPAAQGLMCRRVSPSEQGQLQGAIGSIRGISGMLGPGLFTLTFAAFIGPLRNWHLPGSPFLLSSILLLGSILTVAALKRESSPRNSSPPS
jgi:DHA1 family tetracycline resistance protein-like MFS transporter